MTDLFKDKADDWDARDVPRQLSAGIGACLLTATGLRILMEFDRERYFLWMGCAAAVFLAGTLIWAGFLGPRIVRRLRG